MERFASWLQNELETNGWDQAELARRSGISTTHVSRLINDQRDPGPDACNRIAKALKVPVMLVFREAGLAAPRILGNRSADQKEALLDYFEELAAADRERLLGMARVLYEQAAPYETGEGAGNAKD